MMRLGVDLGAFCLLGVLWASWICGLVSDMNLGRFSAVVSDIWSVPFSLLFLVFPLWVYYTFSSYPTGLGFSVFSVFPCPPRPTPCGMWDLSSVPSDWTCNACRGSTEFNYWPAREVSVFCLYSLCFLALDISNETHPVSKIPSSAVSIKGSLHFCCHVFVKISSVSFLPLLWFVSPSLHFLSVLYVFILCITALSIILIFVLNSQTDNSKLPAVFGSDLGLSLQSVFFCCCSL